MRGQVGRGMTALVAAVVLAGCGGSADPAPTSPAPTSPTTVATPEPTPEPSAEPTESPEPTETGDPTGLPPLPEAAKQNTPEGAEAFIRYYFDVANGLYMNPVTGVLPKLSHEECLSCASMEQTISRMAAASESTRSGVYQIMSMAALGGSFDDVITFNMVVDIPANTITNEAGETVSDTPAGTVTGEGAAQWNGTSWELFGLGLRR